MVLKEFRAELAQRAQMVLMDSAVILVTLVLASVSIFVCKVLSAAIALDSSVSILVCLVESAVVLVLVSVLILDCRP
jgi:hypothetical protein